MPNYSPSEETSLLALLAALRGGMEPTTGYQMFSDVLNQQAARVDERQERLRGLQDLIASQAQGGQSLAGVNALVDAYTPGGGVPPMIQQSVDALYPDRARYEGQPSPVQQAYQTGTTPSELSGGMGPEQGPLPQQAYNPIPPTPRNQQFSPAAPPVDPVAALQAEADAVSAQQTIMEAQEGPPATVGDLVSDIYAAKQEGTPPEKIRTNLMAIPEYAELATKNFSSLSKMFPTIFPDRSQTPYQRPTG